MTTKEQPIPPSQSPGPLMQALREKTSANTIWRFYRTENSRWKWQLLSVTHEIIAESRAAYNDYESCLANAKANGHVFTPSQAKTISAARYHSYGR